MNRLQLEKLLQIPDVEFVSLFEMPEKEPIKILGIKQVKSQYSDNAYIVYTKYGKFYANKK